MNRGIKRQKGGAEKKRAKSRKLLLADSEKSAASASSTSASTNIEDTEQTDQAQGVRQDDSEDSKSLCILKLEFITNGATSACYFHACEVISVCCGHARACASLCGPLVGENARAVF